MYIPTVLLNIIYNYKSQLEHTEKLEKCLKQMKDRHLWVDCTVNSLHYGVNDNSMWKMKSQTFQTVQSELYPGARAHRLRITNSKDECFQRVVFEGFYRTILFPYKTYEVQYLNVPFQSPNIPQQLAVLFH